MSDQTLETVQALLAEGFKPPFHVATIAGAGMILERFDVVGTDEIAVTALGDHMATLFDGPIHQLWTDAEGRARYVRDGKFAVAEWPTPNPN
ncbi:hypothetical protein LCGC14_1578510 [marine sediment metagenome]|uniref:Uncharacterized protein n=1 Tax=marine sediment metagenome TaxID=412755 RepID=A0A0F9KYI7_9ZZZZ